jgi:hypothetical protein
MVKKKKVKQSLYRPRQAEGSRSLRLPDNQNMKVVRLSALHTSHRQAAKLLFMRCICT